MYLGLTERYCYKNGLILKLSKALIISISINNVAFQLVAIYLIGYGMVRVVKAWDEEIKRANAVERRY